MSPVSNGGRARFEVQYRNGQGSWVKWSRHRKRELAEASLGRLRGFYGHGLAAHLSTRLVERDR